MGKYPLQLRRFLCGHSLEGTLRYSRYLIRLPVCLLRVMSVLVVVVLLSGSITSCAPIEDPSYRAVAEALKNEANDPAITARILFRVTKVAQRFNAQNTLKISLFTRSL